MWNCDSIENGIFKQGFRFEYFTAMYLLNIEMLSIIYGISGKEFECNVCDMNANFDSI